MEKHNFDFSKSEDQKKFEDLKPEEKRDIIENGKNDAENMNYKMDRNKLISICNKFEEVGNLTATDERYARNLILREYNDNHNIDLLRQRLFQIGENSLGERLLKCEFKDQILYVLSKMSHPKIEDLDSPNSISSFFGGVEHGPFNILIAANNLNNHSDIYTSTYAKILTKFLIAIKQYSNDFIGMSCLYDYLGNEELKSLYEKKHYLENDKFLDNRGFKDMKKIYSEKTLEQKNELIKSISEFKKEINEDLIMNMDVNQEIDAVIRELEK